MNFFQWIGLQIDWCKSFVSEEKNVPGMKGSSRRVGELGVVYAFIFSYIKVSLSTQVMPSIEMGWIIMIGGILGLKTVDVYMKNKLNGDPTKKTPETGGPNVS